ncbi:MAG: GntR family transcriptional regulator [Eubacterium sp.]|nr:GntR family transcriptional regulator [Eubacterium sp.]
MQEFPLDRNNPKPLYQQFRDIVEEKISSGEWKPDDKIPSENQLSAQYGLSRMTVRSVLLDLVKEDKLYRVQGKGTYVTQQKIEAQSLYYVGVREQLEQMGYEVSTKTIECREVACDHNVAKHLNLEEGTPVFMIKRVRSIKDGPVSIHVSYIPQRYSQGLTPELLEKEQLCVIMNQNYGLQRKRVSETLESVAADKEEASLLNVDKGHPLLLLKDELFSEEDRPYEYTKVIFRGDKFKIRLNYE